MWYKCMWAFHRRVDAAVIWFVIVNCCFSMHIPISSFRLSYCNLCVNFDVDCAIGISKFVPLINYKIQIKLAYF